MDYDFADSYGFVPVFLRSFAGACRLAGCALELVLNTFNFESEKLRVLYSFVGFVGRLCESISTGCVFSIGTLPTSCFYDVGRFYESNAPDSVLSFLLQNRDFVGFVGRFGESISSGIVSLIMLSGGVV